MYEFIAIVTNDYTIDIISNTYWSCKAEGNFKLSKYDGSGNTVLNIEIPDDTMMVEGVVYFSFGDERCKYPQLYVNFTNLCYIMCYPNYTTCTSNDNIEEKTITFFYEDELETFRVSVLCFDNWSVDTSDFDYVTNNNEIMIISSGSDGELRIIPQHQCNGKNTIHIKLIKKAD